MNCLLFDLMSVFRYFRRVGHMNSAKQLSFSHSLLFVFVRVTYAVRCNVDRRICARVKFAREKSDNVHVRARAVKTPSSDRLSLFTEAYPNFTRASRVDCKAHILCF